MTKKVKEFDDIEEFDDDYPPRSEVIDVSDEARQNVKNQMATAMAELREDALDKGLARIGGLGTAVEGHLMGPGKLFWGALDTAQNLPGTKAVTYLRDKILPESITGPLHEIESTPQRWLEYYDQREKQLAREDEALGINDLMGQLTTGTLRAGLDLPQNLIGGTVGKAANALRNVAIGQGSMSGGQRYASERGAGASPLESASKGATDAIITAAVTRAFGDTGIESVFRKEGPVAAGKRVLGALKDMGFEALEEATDTFLSALSDRVTTNPDKPIIETIKDVLMSGAIGGILGGSVSAGRHVLGRRSGRNATAKTDTAPIQEFEETEVSNAVQPESTQLLRPVPEQPGEITEEVSGEGSGPEDVERGGQAVETTEAATTEVIPKSADELLSKPLGSHSADVVHATPDNIWNEAMRRRMGEKWSPTVDATAWAMTQESSPELIAKLDQLAKKDVERAMASRQYPQKMQWYQDAAHVLRGSPVGLENVTMALNMAKAGRIKLAEKTPTPDSIASEYGLRFRGVLGPGKVKTWQFHDPTTGTELGVRADSSADAIRTKIQESRKRFSDATTPSPSPSPVSYFDRISEATGLGRPSTVPTVEDVRAHRAQEERESRGSKKPEIAKLSTSENLNSLGDPVGTSYHATQEDWDRWVELSAPERFFEGWAEREQIKNKYGGQVPAPPKNVSVESTQETEKVKEQTRLSKLAAVLAQQEANIEAAQEKLQKGFHSGRAGTGLPEAALNVALDAVRLGLKAGKTVAIAIDEAIAKLRTIYKGRFDEAQVRQYLERAVAGTGSKEDIAGGPAAEGSTPTGELEVESFQALDPQSGSPIEPETKEERTIRKAVEQAPPSGPQPTGLKNAIGELERITGGLPEARPSEHRPMAQAWLKAGGILANDSQAGRRLADDLFQNPERGMTDEDAALLLRHKVSLLNERKQAAEDALKATTPDAKAEAQKRYDKASAELLDLLDAAKLRGTQWGREGRWRQALAFEDFSLETMTRDKQMSLGRKLTPAELDEIKALHEKIAKLESQLEEARQATENQARTQAVTEATQEAVDNARSERKKDADSGVKRNLEQERQDAIQSLKERFIEQGDLTGGNRTVQQLMELLAANGIDERVAMENAVLKILRSEVDPTITLQDTQDLMSGYGKFKQLSKDPIKTIVRGIRGEIQQVRKLLDFFQGRPAKKTGQERRTPTDKEREWIKLVNKAKKAFNIPADNPEAQLKSAIETVNTRLRNRITDLKQEIATRKKIIKEKTPSPYNEETLRLKSEVEELEKQHKEIFGNPKLSPEQRLKVAKAAAERQIAELERQLKTGEVFNRNKTKDAPTDDELEAFRARIEELKYERDNMRETIQPTMEPEARTLLNILQRYSRLAAHYEERLANKDFAPRQRKEPPVSEDTARAKARLDEAKANFRIGLEKDRYERKDVFRKGVYQLGNLWDDARLLMTTGELSFLLRQGKGTLLSRPGAFVKALPNTMKSLLASKEGAATLNNQLLESGDAKDAQAHGLYLSQPGSRPSAREEIAWGRHAENIPVVRNFNQAGIYFLNKLRLDHYNALAKSLSKTGTPTKEEAEHIAEMVNIFTGRGGLGAAERIPTIMNRTFFSPRYLTSRLQMASGYPIWKPGGSPRMKKLMAKEYGRLLIGYGIYYSMLLGMMKGLQGDDDDEVSVGTDPNSSDFGKIVVGNTRIDPLAGLGQVITMASRTGTGEKTTGSGRSVDIRTETPRRGQEQWLDVATRFGRTKLNPVPGKLIDMFNGTDLMGDPVTVKGAAKDFLMPMTYGDIYDALREQDIPEGTAIALLAMLGEGVKTQNQ